MGKYRCPACGEIIDAAEGAPVPEHCGQPSAPFEEAAAAAPEPAQEPVPQPDPAPAPEAAPPSADAEQ